jgi:hypothetical protein
MTEKIIAALVSRGYRVLMRPFELNIVGIRSSDRTPNVFNDSINAVYKDDKGRWKALRYPATTDPGLYWLKNPMNVLGTAILKAGQYVNSHIIGLHRNKYTALVQRGTVTVIRDATRDDRHDFNGKEEKGLFGINIHRAKSEGVTNVVEKHSAGCQVFANATDFNAFMALCEKHSKLYGNCFSYTLLNEPELQQAA